MSRQTRNAIVIGLIILLASPSQSSAGIFDFLKRCKKTPTCYTECPTSYVEIAAAQLDDPLPKIRECTVRAKICDNAGNYCLGPQKTGSCEDCGTLYQQSLNEMGSLCSIVGGNQGCILVSGSCRDGCAAPFCPLIPTAMAVPGVYEAQVVGQCCDGTTIEGLVMGSLTKAEAIRRAKCSFEKAVALAKCKGRCCKLRCKQCKFKFIPLPQG
ncbi:MAG: hypothetical protein AAGG48_24480 [Planctomycetota bacterium]